MSSLSVVAATSSLGSLLWLAVVLASSASLWYGVVGFTLITAAAWLGVRK